MGGRPAELQSGVQAGGVKFGHGRWLEGGSGVVRLLGIRESVLGRWDKQFTEDPVEVFPGKGRLKSQDEELRRLGREKEVLRQERDILKKRWASSRRCPDEISVRS